MDLGYILVRMALWLRRRPSREFLIAGAAVIALAVIVILIEKAGYWPSAFTLDKPPAQMRVPRM